MKTAESITIEVVKPKTVLELRKAWDDARAELEKHPTYSNSVRVQVAKRELDKAVELKLIPSFIEITRDMILLDAVKEIARRAKELEKQFGFVDFGSEQLHPFRYFYNVADQALELIGEDYVSV